VKEIQHREDQTVDGSVMFERMITVLVSELCAKFSWLEFCWTYSFEQNNELLVDLKDGEFVHKLNDCQMFRHDCVYWIALIIILTLVTLSLHKEVCKIFTRFYTVFCNFSCHISASSPYICLNTITWLCYIVLYNQLLPHREQIHFALYTRCHTVPSAWSPISQLTHKTVTVVTMATWVSLPQTPNHRG
jgi:hypothetical protein